MSDYRSQQDREPPLWVAGLLGAVGVVAVLGLLIFIAMFFDALVRFLSWM